jgi:hypothetical protein
MSRNIIFVLIRISVQLPVIINNYRYIRIYGKIYILVSDYHLLLTAADANHWTHLILNRVELETTKSVHFDESCLMLKQVIHRRTVRA